jgi:hypothetical protein
MEYVRLVSLMVVAQWQDGYQITITFVQVHPMVTVLLPIVVFRLVIR